MIHTHKEAKAIINGLFKNYGTERISIRESWGRTLAEDIFVPRDYPDVNKSAVDGYAVKAGRTEYTGIGEVAAGGEASRPIEPHEAVFVMTGGTVPEGADAVVRIEDCKVERDSVTIPDNVQAGTCVNPAGDEARKGELAVHKGAIIHRGLYPALYYLGKSKVKVYKRPRIAAFVTGDEIMEVEDEFKEGMVFDTNRRILETYLNPMNLKPDFFGPIGDTEEDVARAFKEMCSEHDIIISSGGISMGKYDFVKKVFQEHDFEVLVERTRIKPGSPLMIARREDKLFIGMPGYPAAFLSNFAYYILPALRKALGIVEYENVLHKAILDTDMPARTGRMDINRAIVNVENGRYHAANPGTQLTSHFISFGGVDGLVLIDPETATLKKGEEADLLLLP
ncbi:molybdopterin molybdotransferase MoeA [Limisalsivibrio acetivorans]|uniref:molybdopterin molybdotransferase MoeA n=1 Tax=Limisalsivibrio acetivorans TaxID=1304888 RepID=UPI0003B38863|nr:molybdopterin molybdotransferase MoeA [Limisalsivibrio acetivorans]